MKLALVIFCLLCLTGCAPNPTALPRPAPIPTSIIATSEPPVTSVIISGTSVVGCACPTGIMTPAQPQRGGMSVPPGICNCPAILLTPPPDATEDGSGSQNIPTDGITLADNGRTFLLHPGDSFLLNLGIATFEWTVDIDDRNVLSNLKGVMVIRGAQGIYEAGHAGHALLTAVGNPLCRNSVPPCEMPSIIFRISVIVQ
ncbi:MAG TPA: hypothetical protein VLZ89_13090 [Anaerolineales bacterium]|nr:hypothetical protein [Anaerolineales bacterium]